MLASICISRAQILQLISPAAVSASLHAVGPAIEQKAASNCLPHLQRQPASALAQPVGVESRQSQI